MLPETVRKHISGLPDQELIAYFATGTQVYEPEAIGYASEVLDGRQLDPQTIASAHAVARHNLERIDAKQRELAEKPLDAYDRVVAFATIGGLLDPHHFLQYAFADVQGRHRQAREWSKAGRLGGCTYLSLGGLALLILLDNHIAQIIGGAAFVLGTLLFIVVARS